MSRKGKSIGFLLSFALLVCSSWGKEEQKAQSTEKWGSPTVLVGVGSKTYKLGMMRDKDHNYLAATTTEGQIVRDAVTLEKIYFMQHVYRLSFASTNESLRIEQLDYEIERLQTTLNMSYLTDVVLFLRDASSRALAEAIVAALSGGSSTGRTIAKAAAISGIKSFVKDPVSYAKGINYLTMQSSLTSLQRARKNIAEDVRVRKFAYERAKEIHADLVFGLSRSPTCQVLQGQLYLTQGGKGDLISQMQKVCESIADQLVGKVTESFKNKVLIEEAVLGAEITDFLIKNCAAYAKHIHDTKNLEKDFQYETSQYYMQVIKPTIEHWSVPSTPGRSSKSRIPTKTDFLTTSVMPISFADDGSKVAFLDRKVNSYVLCVADIRSGKVNELQAVRGLSRIAMSGNGKKVAFESNRDGRATLLLADTDTGNVSTLKIFGEHNMVTGMAFSYDGSRLALVCQSPQVIGFRGWAPAVVALDISDKRLRLLSEPGYDSKEVSISSDGRKVFFKTTYNHTQKKAGGGWQVCMADVDEGKRLTIGDPILAGLRASCNGNYLVYWVDSGPLPTFGSSYWWFITDCRSGQETRIAPVSGDEAFVSNNGRFVAFGGYDYHIYVADIGEGNLLELPDIRGRVAGLSADGSKVLVAGEEELFVKDISMCRLALPTWWRTGARMYPRRTPSPSPMAPYNLVGLPLANAEFPPDKAKEYQKLTSEYLGSPVEKAVRLGSGVDMEFVLIPAGDFDMGSAHSRDTQPVHGVRISRPFYISRFEVTQEQYKVLTGKNVSHNGSNRPVEQVSWVDATAFCRMLSKKEGHNFRLPTEAEWEYACTAGTGGDWFLGVNSPISDYAWHRGNSGGTSHSVGKKRPNAFGLYDMYGNVSEWCTDWYDTNYYSKSQTVDPQGPSNGRVRVSRGGDWYHRDRHCLSRYSGEPTVRIPIFGFRVILDLRK